MKRYVPLTAFLALAGLAHATNVAEFFNGYGTETVNLAGLGTATDGWGGAWTSSHPTHATYSHSSDYLPGTQLTWDGGNRFSLEGKDPAQHLLPVGKACGKQTVARRRQLKAVRAVFLRQTPPEAGADPGNDMIPFRKYTV